jgi:hypothetical protein
MAYPHLIEYNEAVQTPTYSFIDKELKLSAIRENSLGLPLVMGAHLPLHTLLLLPGVHTQCDVFIEKYRLLNSNMIRYLGS